MTAGAQHAMTVAFLTVTRPGDLVLTEDVTYAGMLSLAQRLGPSSEGSGHGRRGIAPRRLAGGVPLGQSEGALSDTHPAYTNFRGPVGTAPQGDRRSGPTHDLAIVEDDSYGFLLNEAPPMAAVAPERTYWCIGRRRLGRYGPSTPLRLTGPRLVHRTVAQQRKEDARKAARQRHDGDRAPAPAGDPLGPVAQLRGAGIPQAEH